MAVPQGDKNSYSRRTADLRQAADDRTHGKTSAIATNDSVYSIRRTSTDRADLHPDIKNRGNTRNVRVSTMPGGDQVEDFKNHLSTDKQFNAEYAKKGLQPSSLEDKGTRQPYEPIEQIVRDVETAEEYEQAMAEQQAIELEEEQMEQQVMAEQANQSNLSVPPPNVAKSPNKNTTSKAKKRLARLKAKGLNKAILSAGLFLWSIFQIPLALLGTILFLTAATVDGLVASASTIEPDDGFFTIIGKKVAGAVVDAAGGVLSYVNKFIGDTLGVDLFKVVEGFYGAVYVLLMGYAIILLLTIYIVYKISFLRPLSGEKAGLKIGVFILAVVGYSVPILNLLPWFVAWTFVVGRYPK